MNAGDKELIEEKFKGVYLHQTANFDSISNKLEQILEQTKLTNGRVTKLEVQLRVVRFFSTNPKITLLTFLGILFIVSVFDIKDIISFFKP
jgi:hypothetical protein